MNWVVGGGGASESGCVRRVRPAPSQGKSTHMVAALFWMDGGLFHRRWPACGKAGVWVLGEARESRCGSCVCGWSALAGNHLAAWVICIGIPAAGDHVSERLGPVVLPGTPSSSA